MQPGPRIFRAVRVVILTAAGLFGLAAEPYVDTVHMSRIIVGGYPLPVEGYGVGENCESSKRVTLYLE
jgi:hypothetical protein